MLYPLITLGLSPILIVQGRRARRDTPSLPEAAGARSGAVGNGEPLRLLIVGDSAAAGVGAAHQDEALAGRLLAALCGHYTIEWKLIATTGHALQDVLMQLEQAAAENFDVVVTSIGVNDATAGTPINIWLMQQTRLLALLQEKFSAQHILHSALPPMHFFPALPQPLRWYMGLRARRFNQALARHLKDSARAELVTAEFPLEASYMASDGFHPGPPAYAVWAAQLAAAIRRRLHSAGHKKQTTFYSRLRPVNPPPRWAGTAAPAGAQIPPCDAGHRHFSASPLLPCVHQTNDLPPASPGRNPSSLHKQCRE